MQPLPNCSSSCARSKGGQLHSCSWFVVSSQTVGLDGYSMTPEAIMLSKMHAKVIAVKRKDDHVRASQCIGAVPFPLALNRFREQYLARPPGSAEVATSKVLCSLATYISAFKAFKMPLSRRSARINAAHQPTRHAVEPLGLISLERCLDTWYFKHAYLQYQFISAHEHAGYYVPNAVVMREA